MSKKKKASLAVTMTLGASVLLSACGGTAATNTVAPVATPTTGVAATTVAATTAPVMAMSPTVMMMSPTVMTMMTTTAAMMPTTAAATMAATVAPTSAAGANPAFVLSKRVNLPALAASAPKGGKFTTISLGELAPELHPYPTAGNYTSSFNDVASFIHGGTLIAYNYNSLKYELDTANAMTVKDNKTFTFVLRQDLKWSDGSQVTVADYQFAYDNTIKEDTVNADANYVGLDDFKKLVSVKTNATANTIEVALDNVYAPELALSYVSALIPVSTKTWQGKPYYDASKNPEILKPTVVFGPYTIESYDAKASAVLKVNPNYYGGKSNFDQVVLKPGSPSTVLEALKTNQADWSYNIPPAQYTQAKADANVNLYEWSAVNGTYRYMEYNTKRAPMDDKAFRQAINYAVDRETLIKLAEAGLGTPQYTYLNPSSPYYNKGVNEYKYSIDTAKKLLADSGYKIDGGKLINKAGAPIELTIVFPTTSNPRKLIATYLEQQLKQLGLAVKVDGKEFNAYVKQVNAKDFDISLGASGGGFPDPDNFKSAVITGGTQNNTSYSNTRVDELFKQGAVETDPTKRQVTYTEIQKILNDETPIFFLWNLTNFSATTKRVGGVVVNKGDRLDLNDAVTRWFVTAQ